VCVKRDCALKIIVGIKHILDHSGRMWVVGGGFVIHDNSEIGSNGSGTERTVINAS